MYLFPASIEQKLGFEALRERLDAYTFSRMGQEALEALAPSDHVPTIREVLAQVADFQAIIRFDDANPLGNMPDVREVVRRALPEGAFLQPEALLAVLSILRMTRLLHAYLHARKEKYAALVPLMTRLVPTKNVENRIELAIDDQGQVRDDASPELRQIRRALLKAQHQLRQEMMNEMRKAIGNGYATEDQPTIRHGRMVIPVRSDAKRKIQGFIHDLSATGQTAYIEPTSCLDLNNDIRTFEAQEQREIENILRDVTDEIRTVAEVVLENLEVLGAFDLLHAKARLANELGAMVPHLNTDGLFRLKKARNPVLALRFQDDGRKKYGAKNQTSLESGKREIVPLDLELGNDFRTLIITGPNAGGKSVAMKTVGLLALMLSYGIPIPANGDASSCCLFTHLFADIGDEQSIENDLSTFSSHLTNLRFMLSTADNRTLVLIDEAGTGTDPSEGAALSQAMLEHLTKVGACTIVTTHHGSLKVFAHETEGVENGAMQFDQATITPTYKLQVGIPGSSYAFEMAQRLELPPAILHRAKALLGTQQSSLENLLQTFSQRNLVLEQELKEAEEARESLREGRRKYDELTAHLQSVKDKIREDALRDAMKVVQEANAQVEKTIREIKEAQAEQERTKLVRAELEAVKNRLQTNVQNLQKRKEKRPKPKTPPAPAAPKAPSVPLAIGDQVVLTGSSTAAEVVELDEKNAVIVQGAVRMKVKRTQIQKVGGRKKQQVTVKHQASNPSGLHHTQFHLDVRGERVEEALQIVTRFIDDAIAANLERVEILHGTGTGALRLSIQDYLRKNTDVRRFEQAPWDQGGAGVTYIYF
jgi:DNA mismatch repair protein MutS2